jgi:hypothetical protein
MCADGHIESTVITKFITVLLASMLLLATFFPQSISAQSNCPKKSIGDTDCNNSIDLNDFTKFREEFILSQKGQLDINAAKADFNSDMSVDLTDFNAFRNGYIAQINTTPTITLTKTPTPLQTIIPTQTTNPTVTVTTTLTPVPVSGKGIWISKEEIMKLPVTGTAWTKVKAAADSNWGAACLHDNNCPHDVNTLAGALVATRLGDTNMRNKVIAGIQAAMKSGTSRTLELARGLQAYPIAADIIGYYDAGFASWLREIQDRSIPGRLGNGLFANALKDSTNWGGHERAACIAVNLYLNDTTRLNQLARAYREYIGENVTPKTMVYEATNWHADSNNKAGVNRKGTIIQGKHVSGVLPEDWRRGSSFNWPPTPSGYMLEGLQGFAVTAILLHRANLVPFSAGDNALVRAMDMVHGTGEAAANSPVFKYIPSGDDTWIPWVVNYYGGTSFPTSPSIAGKNMGWTDWTHVR